MVVRLLHLFSHGMSEWLFQRLTAIAMALYTVVLAFVLLYVRPEGYEAWHSVFEPALMKIGTFAFMLSLLLHAWIGVQDVLSDYIKPTGLRSMFKLMAAAMVIAMGGWSLLILWGSAA